ncbi:hypothetical protein RJ639_020263 [Escallonia herrerae]|uniref:Peptidase C1A papain C-terminal domain-containing protein n=1 Tax=Escallonia herrerae TaxID=1293975 RepID=A0AA89AGR2_9ASTE|nr:hypothetical protein RJ639_020263 [Escallonia herrerae]
MAQQFKSLDYKSVRHQGAEDELKHAICVVRPASVAFKVVNAFRFFKEGVYTSDHCGKTPMVRIPPFQCHRNLPGSLNFLSTNQSGQIK